MELISRRKPLVAIAAAAVVVSWASSLIAAEEAKRPAAPAPTLELKIDGPAKAEVDGSVTFEVVITNAGKTPARGLVIIDRFDPGLEHAVGQSPIERSLKDLEPGQSQRMGLVFRVTRSGRLSHTVEVATGATVLTSARASLSAVALKRESGKPEATQAESVKPEPGKTEPGKTDLKSVPQPETVPGLPPGVKPAPGSFFPEIKPKTDEEIARERAEEKLPDLGPVLVDNPDEIKRLHPKYPVWLDKKNKRVVVQGAVCSRECPLELFACLRASKDYESVVSVPGKASLIHAGLVAAGAEPGSPVQFRPSFAPPRGSEIEVTVVWKDASGNRQTARAQDWVREVKSKKAMSHPWVFSGSRILKDKETGETAYYADLTGELICVSNFAAAMLDVPMESTSSDADLLFEAFTERIPPRGTPVTLILTPKAKK
jgi:uncharacterized repeat protein (TIGR01451 family)